MFQWCNALSNLWHDVIVDASSGWRVLYRMLVLQVFLYREGNKGLFAIVLFERTVHNLNHPNDGVFLEKLFSCTKLTVINDNSKDFPPALMHNVWFFQYEITMKQIGIYKQALVDRLKEVRNMYWKMNPLTWQLSFRHCRWKCFSRKNFLDAQKLTVINNNSKDFPSCTKCTLFTAPFRIRVDFFVLSQESPL